MAENRTYLDPAALARVGNLPLVARQVVEGFLSGRHRSPYQGFSIEYLDHRPYVQGDEMRSIDWKILAKTDKLYVKLFEQETNLRAHIILDCSRSMEFKGESISKLQYGSLLAASLSYLLLRQNDAVGLTTFNNEIDQYVPPKAHPTQFRRLLIALEKANPKPDTDLGKILTTLAERIGRRGLVIIISDLLDDLDKVVNGLTMLRHLKHEVIIFHVMDKVELTFPFDKSAVFRDMEGAGFLSTNPHTVRAGYLKRLNEYLSQLKAECLKRKIDYNLLATDTPYDLALASYLHQRAKFG